MATTDEDLQQQDQEYSQAFAEPEVEAQQVDEDAAFGLTPDEVEVESEVAPANEAVAEDGSSHSAAVEDAPTGGEIADGVLPAETEDEKELQRQRSWEGRLRAREAELAAREDALKALEEGKTGGETEVETPAQEAAEEQTERKEDAAELSSVVQQVEDGEMTPEDALAQITSDFGPEFAKAVNALFTAAAKTAAKAVDERLAPVNQQVDGLVAGITDKAARDHFEAISEAHPDFVEVAQGQELKDYLASLPDDKRAKEEAIVERGSARQIIKLLNNVKSFAAANDTPEPEQAPKAIDPAVADAMDAAAGVRSRGMSIPEKPQAASDDYEAAWADIPD